MPPATLVQDRLIRDDSPWTSPNARVSERQIQVVFSEGRVGKPFVTGGVGAPTPVAQLLIHHLQGCSKWRQNVAPISLPRICMCSESLSFRIISYHLISYSLGRQTPASNAGSHLKASLQFCRQVFFVGQPRVKTRVYTGLSENGVTAGAGSYF